MTIEISGALMTYLDPDSLPKDGQLYNDYPAEELDAFLQEAFRQTESLAMAVPSVIIPQSVGRNILLNPLNLNINKVNIIDIRPYVIDPGLPWFMCLFRR